jgi:hypothetical protein
VTQRAPDIDRQENITMRPNSIQRNSILIPLLAVLLVAVTPVSMADYHGNGGHYGHGGHYYGYGGRYYGHGGHYYYGAPWLWAYPSLFLFSQPAYSYPDPQPVIIQQPAPTVVVQPATTAPAPQIAAPQAAQQYWYHCDNPQGYYPYVTACPGGWKPVPSTPPGAAP